MSHRFKRPKNGSSRSHLENWEPKVKFRPPVLFPMDSYCCSICKEWKESGLKQPTQGLCPECFAAVRNAVRLVKKARLIWGLCQQCGFVPAVQQCWCSLCQNSLLSIADFVRSKTEVYDNAYWKVMDRLDMEDVKIDEDTFLQPPKEGRMILL